MHPHGLSGSFVARVCEILQLSAFGRPAGGIAVQRSNSYRRTVSSSCSGDSRPQASGTNGACESRDGSLACRRPAVGAVACRSDVCRGTAAPTSNGSRPNAGEANAPTGRLWPRVHPFCSGTADLTRSLSLSPTLQATHRSSLSCVTTAPGSWQRSNGDEDRQRVKPPPRHTANPTPLPSYDDVRFRELLR